MTFWDGWESGFDDRMPIYRQIILKFNRAFVRGEIKPGERVPSIRELSARLKVNTNTIQRVYQEMERDEMITSKRGTGYFFTEESVMADKTRRILARESLCRFVEEMRALGCGDENIVDELNKFIKEEKGCA
jgi:DNA-binding transcriptional regulator YhcF (GntR family)